MHLIDDILQHPSEDVEVVATQLTALSSLALRRVEKHVKLHAHSWLKAGLERYKEKVANKVAEVKVTGFDPVQDVWYTHAHNHALIYTHIHTHRTFHS